METPDHAGTPRTSRIHLPGSGAAPPGYSPDMHALRPAAAPGDPVSADVTCAEDPKARLFISKGRGAQGLDELSRDLWFRV